MAQLAIKGHVTRGKEVIEILKMLGGKNIHNSWGVFGDRIYTIDEKTGEITDVSKNRYSNYNVFSLEEFLEKYPYKVGDKVSVYEYEAKVRINDMRWDGFEIQYSVFTDETEWYSVEELNKCNEPYKEETMKEKGTLVKIDLTREIKKFDEIEVILGDYEFVLKNGKTYFVKKQLQYPKTYKECCEVLGIEEDLWFVYEDIDGRHINPVCISNYRTRRLDLYHNFEKLLIHRDAYWKIVGEQMGLGKPWKPDWLNTNVQKHCIFYVGNEIKKQPMLEVHNFLAFPTYEMCDAFYENFKNLIEQCKEFL